MTWMHLAGRVCERGWCQRHATTTANVGAGFAPRRDLCTKHYLMHRRALGLPVRLAVDPSAFPVQVPEPRRS